MKKQLLTAAVAATMSVSALADISITGAASMTWTGTDFDAATTANTTVYANDMDITITGTSGGTTATASIDISDDLVSAGDVVVTTTLAGVSLEMTEDAGALALEAVLPAVAGVTLTFNDSNANSNGSIKAAMTLMGLDASVTKAATATKSSIGGDLGGITVTYANNANDAANSDTNSLAVSGDVGGVALAMTSYQGSSASAAWLDMDGDAAAANESDNGTAMSATMDLGGNSITVSSNNFSLINTVTVDETVISGTRALDSGATLTGTYTRDELALSRAVALKISVTF